LDDEDTSDTSEDEPLNQVSIFFLFIFFILNNFAKRPQLKLKRVSKQNSENFFKKLTSNPQKLTNLHFLVYSTASHVTSVMIRFQMSHMTNHHLLQKSQKLKTQNPLKYTDQRHLNLLITSLSPQAKAMT